MRKFIALAALALSLAAPASAMAGGWGPMGGWHHGGGFGWRHGLGWGGVGFGLGAVVIGESCYRERPVYNEYGEVVGVRTVNVCY